MSKKFISDLIGDSYQAWDSSKPVIIHAPMGSGKTYFVLNILLPYVQRQGKRLVYVANRSALELQVDRDIPNKYRDSIITCSYQRFANINLNAYNESIMSNEHMEMDRKLLFSDYYILDEAHYVLADSSFNIEIERCFSIMNGIQKKSSQSIWVYMTATIPYLLLHLQKPRIEVPYLEGGNIGYDKTFYYNTGRKDGYSRKKQFYSINLLLEYKEAADSKIEAYNATLNGLIWLSEDHFKYKLDYFRANYFGDIAKAYDNELFADIREKYCIYSIRQDFSYINPIYFDKWDEIVTAVSSTPENEKWLIFVSSKNSGRELKQQLEDNGCIDVVFITAEEKRLKKLKEYAVFHNIVDHASFEQRVLISTKVLDNGINLKDEALKHMVIEAYEETTFLQMVGRK